MKNLIASNLLDTRGERLGTKKSEKRTRDKQKKETKGGKAGHQEREATRPKSSKGKSWRQSSYNQRGLSWGIKRPCVRQSGTLA